MYPETEACLFQSRNRNFHRRCSSRSPRRCFHTFELLLRRLCCLQQTINNLDFGIFTYATLGSRDRSTATYPSDRCKPPGKQQPAIAGRCSFRVHMSQKTGHREYHLFSCTIRSRDRHSLVRNKHLRLSLRGKACPAEQWSHHRDHSK